MQQHRRSIVKATTYRIIATSLVIIIAFAVTGSAGPAAKIGVVAAVGKTTLYYVWERLWNRITWGIQPE